MKYHVTLKDIAKEAGVSVTTVCRALQNKAEISEPTKQKIKELAEKYDYQPNVIARSLRLREMRVLGLLIPDNSNPYFARLVKGVEETAKKNNYAVIVANTNEDTDIEQNAINTLVNLRVAGLLAVPVDVENYIGLKLPLMFLSRFKRKEGNNSVNFVINDDFKGSYLATSCLLEKGKNRIYFINGPKGNALSMLRLEGYKKALADSGIPFDEKLVIYGNMTIEDGYNSFKNLIKRTETPFGIICYSDYVAMGVLSAIREQKLSIPDDVSIVGYDDIEMVSYLDVPLTTIKQARYMIGAKGTELLMEIIENSKSFKQLSQIVLEPELVVRKST